MPEYTLKVRRYQPETGNGPYWQEFHVPYTPSMNVLMALGEIRKHPQTADSQTVAPVVWDGRISVSRAISPSTALKSRTAL